MPDGVGILLAVLAILCGGVLKGAIGMGAPLIAIPVLAAIYNVPTAIALMTLPLLVSNIWQMWKYQEGTEGRAALRLLVGGCVIGVVIGTMLLGALPEAWLSVGLALMILAYLSLLLSRPSLALSERRARGSAFPVGIVTGTLQGAAGLSSPVGATFIHAQRLGRTSQVFALSAMFFTLSATQILALMSAGIMSWSLAALSLAALIPTMTGVWIGQVVGAKVSHRTFERLTLSVIFVIAVGLLVDAVPELISAPL